MSMDPKLENEKLLQENAALVKTNAGISESINASKLALEQAKEQEAAGQIILENISKEIEERQAYALVVKKEVDDLNSDVEKLLDQKTKLELSISEARSDAGEKYKAERIKHESEIEKLAADIVLKRSEVSEITTKAITEKSKLDKINLDIKNAEDARDVVNAQLAGLELQIKDKKQDLDELTLSIDAAENELDTIKKISGDTKISIEAYEDRKAALIAEIGILNDELNSAKTKITTINTEITELEVRREEKDAEYNASVSKIFELKRREEAVTEREDYAKAQFKEAGLSY
jgi:chromosome segregation ATPase